METKDRATRVAVLTALRDAIDIAIDNDREDLTYNLKDLSNMFGVKSIDIELPNGDKVATASLSISDRKPFVNSEKDFLNWVQENHPNEIVRIVRASFQKALFERAVVGDIGEAVDFRTGEIIAGVLFSDGGVEKLTVRFKKNGRELVADAFREGELEAIIRSIGLIESSAEVKNVENLLNENLGDSPANDQAIKPQPSGALGG